MCLCVFTCTMCVQVPMEWKSASAPLELEWQAVPSSQTWTLCKSKKSSHLLSHLSSSSLRHLSGSAFPVHLKLLVPASLLDPKDHKEFVMN